MARIKLFAFFILGTALFITGILVYPCFFVFALSEDVLPDSLNGAVLYSVYEEPPDEYLIEGLTAYYQSQDQDISILFWKLSSEELVQESKNFFIDDLKAEYSTMFDKIEWDTEHTYEGDNYEAVASNFTAYSGTEVYEAGVIAAAAGEHFLVVQIVDYADKPSLNELLSCLDDLVDSIPKGHLSSGGEVNLPNEFFGADFVSGGEVDPTDDIKAGQAGIYETDEKDILLLLYQLVSEVRAEEIADKLIDDMEAEFNVGFDSVSWGEAKEVDINGNKSKIVNFQYSLYGVDVEAGLIYTTIKDYFVFVQIIYYSKGPVSDSELMSALESAIELIPEGSAPGEEGEEEEEELCGNSNCEYWQGETCKNCRADCYIDGFCCLPGYSFIYAHDYHNGIYNIHEALAGVIPRGAIILSPGLTEEDMPLRPPSVCDKGGIAAGECVFNYDCPSGVCGVDNWCIRTYSDKEQEVEDQEVVEKIYEEQTSYKKEYVEAYELMEGGIGQIIIKDASLDVELEVQGNTAGKVAETIQGDEVETRLTIENNSDYSLALTAGIFYPSYESNTFDIEEKKYTVSFKWEGGLSSLIGSFKTKLIGSRFMVMPPGSEVIVYSKIVPRETGYLDVQGLVFFNAEKKYREWNPGFVEEPPKNYQESEVTETILVNEKPCSWWPICL